ncbi:MAG: thiamine phosphate synthase [Thermoguttaceae bacterium]
MKQDNNNVSASVPHPRPLPEGEETGRDSEAEPIVVLRVLDAAWNRAREGLRVVEDYTRFVLDDRHLTEQLKQLRHELTAAMATVPLDRRLAARETQADVGTRLSTPAERRRQDAAEVLTANFIRLQESLRSLEEFSKILDPELAARLEQFRYRTYTLHRAVEITRASLARLGRARLYVLIDGQASPERFATMVGALVGAGVDVLQLRDKQLDDRVLLQRARLLHELTQGTQTLFVMNDRPDLAVLARADGVHVGQEELTVKDVRTIVGPEMLIGVSTHGLDQARQAVLDGADYLGVGPTFPSGTKQFAHFPGLAFLRQVAAEIRLPAFAIGGINRENLSDVLATGITRIALSGAITAAANPATAAQELRAMVAFGI